MRPSTACAKCRSRRRKCTATGPGIPCARCKSAKVFCSFAAEKRVSHSLPSLNFSQSSNSNDAIIASGGEVLMPEHDVCNALINLYFDILHDAQHILFHRATFMAKQRDNKIPGMIVLAMMALAARFCDHAFFEEKGRWDAGRVWANGARVLFNAREVPVDLAAVQACSLQSILSFIEGDMASESLYGALTIRMVLLLGLPNRLSDSVVERETQIRVWWSTWMMDSWSSAGANLPKQLTAEPFYPQPMDEISFASLEDGKALNLDTEFPQERETGLWAQMIPLTDILGQVNGLHEMTIGKNPSQSQIYDTVQGIAARMDSWLFRLPPRLQNTPENLKYYTEHGFGHTFVALHIGFHHHGQLLYYQFLGQKPNPMRNPTLAYTYAMRCKAHAAELSNLLWAANKNPESQCLWVITGHLLAISSSVHLHTLLFDQHDDEVTRAKEMLEHNFELMIRLRRYWPSLDLSMSRLRAFHRACQENANISFEMDDWMLVFLQRYMQNIGDKTVQFNPNNMSVDIDAEIQTYSSVEELWYGSELEGTGFDVVQSFL